VVFSFDDATFDSRNLWTVCLISAGISEQLHFGVTFDIEPSSIIRSEDAALLHLARVHIIVFKIANATGISIASHLHFGPQGAAERLDAVHRVALRRRHAPHLCY